MIVCAHQANRDAEAGGAEFDITREGAGKRALTFGAGIDDGLGANLARAELSEALCPPRAVELGLDSTASRPTTPSTASTASTSCRSARPPD